MTDHELVGDAVAIEYGEVGVMIARQIRRASEKSGGTFGQSHDKLWANGRRLGDWSGLGQVGVAPATADAWADRLCDGRFSFLIHGN
jgi:hypothetical protein